MMVKTSYGRLIDFDAASMLMDDDIYDMLRLDDYDSDQEFYDAYVKFHLFKYGEEFEPDKLTGQW